MNRWNVVLLLMCCVCLPLSAFAEEWVALYENPTDEQVYLDTDSVSGSGGIVEYRVMYRYTTARKAGNGRQYTTAISRYSSNCTNDTLLNRKQVMYAGDSVVYSARAEDFGRDYRPVVAGSVGAFVHNLLCNR